MSFPIRPTRDSLGPTLENKRPVTNPKKEIPDTTFNAAFWTLTGGAQVMPLATVQCTVAASVLSMVGHAEAWNPNAVIAGPTPVRVSPGIYTFTYAAQYADELGVQRSVAFGWGGVDMHGVGASGVALLAYASKDAPNVMRVVLLRRDTGAPDDGPFAARFY